MAERFIMGKSESAPPMGDGNGAAAFSVP